MNTSTLTMAVVVAALSGCAIKPPVIYDLNQDRAEVQHYLLNKEPEVTQVAVDACAIHGRKAFGPLSSREIETGVYTSLYACKDH